MDRTTFTEEPCREASEKFAHPKKINSKNVAVLATSNPNSDARKVARKLYHIRQKRDKFFRSGLFSDPAWDILLDLYMAEEDQKKIYITSACIAAGVPTSTGLRWITILIQNGYVERRDDPNDARRSFLALTDVARDALEALLVQFREA